MEQDIPRPGDCSVKNFTLLALSNDLFGETTVPKDAIVINEGLYGVRTRNNRTEGNVSYEDALWQRT